MSKDVKVVYVTGCLGFIGSYITRKCLDRGWFVKGVDKITYASNTTLLPEFTANENFSFVHCDINDLTFLYDCDYVINTAAETHVGNSIVSSDEFIKSNVNGVHNLLQLIRNFRQETGKRPVLLHFSTDEVYGDIVVGDHVETDMLSPSNPYSATKAAADMLIQAWHRTYGVPYIIVRPTNNYGIGQYVEKLIPKAIKYLTLRRSIPLHNNGEPIRNWLHVDDTANAVMQIIDAGAVNEIYNVCGGIEYRNIDVITNIIHEFYCNRDGINISDYIDTTISRDGQDVRYGLDDTKLRALGWTPNVRFDCIEQNGYSVLHNIVNYYNTKFIW